MPFLLGNFVTTQVNSGSIDASFTNEKFKKAFTLDPKEKIPRSLIDVFVAFIYSNLSPQCYAFGEFCFLFKDLGIFQFF